MRSFPIVVSAEISRVRLNTCSRRLGSCVVSSSRSMSVTRGPAVADRRQGNISGNSELAHHVALRIGLRRTLDRSVSSFSEIDASRRRLGLSPGLPALVSTTSILPRCPLHVFAHHPPHRHGAAPFSPVVPRTLTHAQAKTNPLNGIPTNSRGGNARRTTSGGSMCVSGFLMGLYADGGVGSKLSGSCGGDRSRR